MEFNSGFKGLIYSSKELITELNCKITFCYEHLNYEIFYVPLI